MDRNPARLHLGPSAGISAKSSVFLDLRKSISYKSAPRIFRHFSALLQPRGLTMKLLRTLTVSFSHLLVLLLVASPASYGETLFYGGDATNLGEYLNQSNYLTDDFTQYAQFTVPSGQYWNVSSLFANTLYNMNDNSAQNSPTNSTAVFEIRSGVTTGDGGILLSTGTVSAIPSPNGFSNAGYDGFRLEADLPSPILLGEGSYWASLVPIGDGSGFAFIYLTDGTNGTGTGNQTNYFTSGASVFEPTTVGYSLGVLGELVLEPSSAILLLTALLGMRRCRRWT